MKTVYWRAILGNIHFKNDLQLSMRANHISVFIDPYTGKDGLFSSFSFSIC